MTQSEELKACPFCGGKDINFKRGTSRYGTQYRCEDCGCSLETGETWDAPQSWNARADTRPPLEHIEGLTELLETYPFDKPAPKGERNVMQAYTDTRQEYMDWVLKHHKTIKQAAKLYADNMEKDDE